MSKAKRGFGSMDKETASVIQRKGGKAAHAKGTGRQWTVEEARAAGSKGGLQASANRNAKLRAQERP